MLATFQQCLVDNAQLPSGSSWGRQFWCRLYQQVKIQNLPTYPQMLMISYRNASMFIYIYILTVYIYTYVYNRYIVCMYVYIYMFLCSQHENIQFGVFSPWHFKGHFACFKTLSRLRYTPGISGPDASDIWATRLTGWCRGVARILGNLHIPSGNLTVCYWKWP